jgi:hypothetical protein
MGPPSFNPDGGYYNFLRGNIADLPRLPKLHGLPSNSYLKAIDNDALPFTPDGIYEDYAELEDAEPVPCGRRNTTLYEHCRHQAKRCADIDAQILEAKRFRERCEDPASIGNLEVIKTATSAWKMEIEGRNWIGGGVVAIRHTEIDTLAYTDHAAFAVLSVLRRHHWGGTFVVANSMAEQFGMGPKRFAQIRAKLERLGLIVRVADATPWSPASYRWPDAAQRSRYAGRLR